MKAAIVGLVLLLASCATAPQPEQSSAELTVFEPVWECHVEAEFSGDYVLFTASQECSPNRIIPFTIEHDGRVLYDGGVYAHNTSSWLTPTWPGTYSVVHGQHGGLIATVEVE